MDVPPGTAWMEHVAPALGPGTAIKLWLFPGSPSSLGKAQHLEKGLSKESPWHMDTPEYALPASSNRKLFQNNDQKNNFI